MSVTWWMVGWAAGPAWATPEVPPLAWEILPEPAPWKGEALPRDPRERPEGIPLVRGRVAADGRLDERAWSEAPRIGLLPARPDQPVPSTTVSVLYDGTGLALALRDVDQHGTIELALDPDGAGDPWWLLSVSAGQLTVSRCSATAYMDRTPRMVPDRAVPCEPGEQGVAWAATGDGVEVFLPWASTERPTSALALQVTATGPSGQGTWSTAGSMAPIPRYGRTLDTGRAAPSLRVQSDCDHDRYQATLLVKDPDHAGPWLWTTLVFGDEVRQGVVEAVPRQPSTWSLEGMGAESITVLARRAVPDGPDEGAVGSDLWVRCHVAMATPVFRDHLDLVYQLDDPADDVPLTVHDGRGRLLGQATVTLPSGRGILRVQTPRAFGREVRVSLAPWLQDATALRR